MTTYDDEIYFAIQKYIDNGLVVPSGTSSEIGNKLYASFPFLGSKVDWAALPLSIERQDYEQSSQMESFIEFFNEMRDQFDLSGNVLYLGDDRTDVVLKSSMQVFSEILRTLLDVPQHNYFIDEKFRWCMCFSFEGDMAFGYRSTFSLQ